MLYQQPFDQPLVPNASYVDGNATNGTPGSIPRAAGIEFPQREIVNAQLAASLTPTNGDMTQLAQALSIGLWLGQMGGTANAITDALPTLATTSDGVTQYAIPALVPGMTFHGIIPATNTGPATLTLTGFGTAPGAKNIVRKDGTPLQPGDQIAGATGSWKWDGTSYRVVGMVASDVAAATLFYGPDTSTTANTVTVAIPAFAAGPTIGRPFEVKIANTLTGASKISVNGATAVNITRADGTPTQAGDLVAGQDAAFVFDGTNVQIQNLLTSLVPARNSVTFGVGSGSWPVPAGVTKVFAQLWAGGGGGGGSSSTTNGGGGGGAGGYVEAWIYIAPGTASLPYIVGAGGAQGVGSSGAAGGSGGTTSFAGGVIYATGGTGGGTNNGAQGLGGNGVGSNGTTGAGVSNVTGIFQASGGNGGTGGYLTSDTSTGYSGFGAPSYQQSAIQSTFSGSVDGFGPGTGGSGCCRNARSGLGGLGANGLIKLTW